MKNILRSAYIILPLIFMLGCEGIVETDEEDTDSSTMCYTTDGSYVSVNCNSDYLGSCASDGKSSLGQYDTWGECYDDIDNVLDNYENTGSLVVGPNANGSSSSNDSSSSSSDSDISHCYSSIYQPWNDPQVDTQCQTACSYEAINYPQGVLASCQILSAMMGSSASECPACR